jgi:hypothetical protein
VRGSLGSMCADSKGSKSMQDRKVQAVCCSQQQAAFCWGVVQLGHKCVECKMHVTVTFDIQSALYTEQTRS